MNDFSYETAVAHTDALYYWDRFYPIVAAVAILLVGWIVALLIAAGVKKLLHKLNTNQRLSSTTGNASDVEGIVSKVVFWFVLLLAIVGALNVLSLNNVGGPFSTMLTQVLVFIPNLIAAIVVGFIGWIIAKVVRLLIIDGLVKTKLDEKLSTEVGVKPISKNIADIVYWLILLLFFPIVLSILGLTGLLYPVQNMVNDVVAFLPHLFIAFVIVFIGYILAKIVRGIVQGLCESLNLQAAVEKVGLFKTNSIGHFLGSFFFIVVIVTALIIAFEALGIESISQPATAMLFEIMNAIPQIIAAILILAIAYVVSRFIAQLVTELLAGTVVDRIPEKLHAQGFLGQVTVSKAIGWLIVFFTMLFAVAEAANRLGFEQISGLISMFIVFGADILLGAIILVIGFWLANVFGDAVQRGEKNSSRWLGNLVRILIMGLVIAMGLKAMGIADSIVNLAFGLTLGAVAVAFAIAFGVGGRHPAERVLNHLLDKAECGGTCEDLPKKEKPKHTHATHTANAVKSDVEKEATTEAKPEAATDHSVPTTFDVDPDHTPLNNPYGSKGENSNDSPESIDDKPKNDADKNDPK